MSKVMVHATVTVDGFMADLDGGVDWMNGFSSSKEDDRVIAEIVESIGAVVGGANKTQTIEDGEVPYGGLPGVPVYLMTHSAHAPIERNGVGYHFIVEDVEQAVEAAKRSAGAKWVSILGGSISRQCLALGLVDEIQLHVVPIVLGQGIPLFAGLGTPIRLERVDTRAFASAAHLRFRILA